jgi:signal transduction histidine kinase
MNLSRLGRPRVLAVDDNVALLDNLGQILEDEGYEVVACSSGEQALSKARDGFDVALVDLRLPDGSGTTLAGSLKDLVPDGEVVLLTGFATMETAIAAVRSGAFAYLVKPCSTPDLLLTIEQAMRQVRLHGEKRELSRRAQVAEKLAAVGTMTAGLSHEIRNPLNAAGLQLVVLERGIRRLPIEQQPVLLAPLQLVRDEIKRLGHLLDDFLQFARPRELVPKPVDLVAVIDSVLGLFEGEAERREITFERELDDKLPPIAGDEERIRQVLTNLTLNALEATPPGGRVKALARAVRDEVLLAIEDSGQGIPADVRGRIFEPFFTTKPSGSGLGLPIVHAIVTQHGGSIIAESPPGRGARFVMRFPRLLG